MTMIEELQRRVSELQRRVTDWNLDNHENVKALNTTLNDIEGYIGSQKSLLEKQSLQISDLTRQNAALKDIVENLLLTTEEAFRAGVQALVSDLNGRISSLIERAGEPEEIPEVNLPTPLSPASHSQFDAPVSEFNAHRQPGEDDESAVTPWRSAQAEEEPENATSVSEDTQESEDIEDDVDIRLDSIMRRAMKLTSRAQGD